MALRIIGAGFGRTGTASMFTALKQLGFPCYHMFEVLENPDNKHHLDFWNKVANAPAGAQHDWEEVFENYAAAVDNPAACVWRELTEAFPDARVLLTLHPKGPDAWYDSTIDTIYFTENLWQFKVIEWFTPFGRKFGNMARKLIWQRSHKGTMDDRTSAIARYNQHIEDVKAAVPADRLLIFTADQGWGPLCKFLDVPEPAGEFPNVNDRTAIKGVIAGLTKGAYGIIAAAAVVFAIIVYAAFNIIG